MRVTFRGCRTVTVRKCALIDYRAPGAGQLLDVKANGKFIFGVGLQTFHRDALFIPSEDTEEAAIGSVHLNPAVI